MVRMVAGQTRVRHSHATYVVATCNYVMSDPYRGGPDAGGAQVGGGSGADDTSLMIRADAAARVEYNLAVKSKDFRAAMDADDVVLAEYRDVVA